MSGKPRLALFFIAPVAATWLALSAPIRVHAADEFERLHRECWQSINAGDYRTAERLALQLHQLANRRFAGQPVRRIDALDTLANVYWGASPGSNSGFGIASGV